MWRAWKPDRPYRLELQKSRLEIEEANAQLREQNEELRRANEMLEQLSITDGLTKLHNHRYFQDCLTRETKRANRSKEPLTLLLIDVDDFKQLNDRHGHVAGDKALRHLATVMNQTVRETDLLARYGGEEFVVLAPRTDLAGAITLEETIREWEPTSKMVVSIDSATKLPIQSGKVTFDLDGDGSTTVSLHYEYETKWGFVGRMMGGLVDRQLTKGFTGFLRDLDAAATAGG